jgi:DtxR family transcriptional regulator, Mn-dependent transcriptional regulator
MQTIASENLLKAVLELNENGENVIAARLAEFLHISSAAVSMALKRLQNRKHVKISRKHSIHLTADGFRVASSLVRRHRLVERLLTDMLHMPWEQVHDEAEKLEHAISPALERKLLDIFGEHGTCPHGSPFQAAAHVRGPNYLPLTEAPENTPMRVLRIAEVHENEKGFLSSLAAVRLIPGSEVTVVQKSFDGILELRVGQRKATFSSASGAMIWVERATSTPEAKRKPVRKPRL